LSQRIYHYTDRLSAAEILRDGRIRARPTTLYKDVHGAAGGSRGYTTPPLIWLSINPLVEPTIVWKLIGAGWPKRLVNDLWRFVLPASYAPMGLAEYSDANRIDTAWWQWVVQSGAMVGSDYTTWRLYPRHIPREDWAAVEVLADYDTQSRPIWIQFEG
jgi:hypothetical protein